MHIYALTAIGKRLARSVSTSDTPAYRVIHHLDKVGHSTVGQIAEFCGMSVGDTSSILSVLRRRKIVVEVSGVSGALV